MAVSAAPPSDFGWLVTDFVRRVAGVAHAVLVTSDGLLLAKSAALPVDRAEQLCAVASGLMNLSDSAADSFQGGAVNQTVIEMELGYLLMMSIGDGSILAVLASPRCDIGAVAYEMTLLVDRVGAQLTPGRRDQPRHGVRGNR